MIFVSLLNLHTMMIRAAIFGYQRKAAMERLTDSSPYRFSCKSFLQILQVVPIENNEPLLVTHLALLSAMIALWVTESLWHPVDGQSLQDTLPVHISNFFLCNQDAVRVALSAVRVEVCYPLQRRGLLCAEPPSVSLLKHRPLLTYTDWFGWVLTVACGRSMSPSRMIMTDSNPCWRKRQSSCNTFWMMYLLCIGGSVCRGSG